MKQLLDELVVNDSPKNVIEAHLQKYTFYIGHTLIFGYIIKIKGTLIFIFIVSRSTFFTFY